MPLLPLSPPLSQRLALLMLTLAYGLALFSAFAAEWQGNFSGLYALYDDKQHYGIDSMLVITLVSLTLACLTQSAGRAQRIVFCLLFTLLTLTSLIATAHAKLYAAPVSVGAIDAMLGTDLQEAGEFLRFQFSLGLCLILLGYIALISWGLGWLRPRLPPQPLCFKTHSAVYCLIVGLALASYQHPAFSAAKQNAAWLQPFGTRFSILNQHIPALRMMVNIADWLEYRQWLRDSQVKRAQYDYHAQRTTDAPRTLLLILGESMRRGNASLYGYDKPTTPLLQHRQSHLLLFYQAIAPANQTIPSVTKILTPATVQDPDRFLERPSIIGAARQAGYKTFWLSNQGRVGNFDSMISLFAREADTTVYTNTEFYAGTYDSILLPSLQQALADSAPHKLIVLHLQGSHQDYGKRYPPEFARFTANQYRPEPKLKKSLDAKRREALARYDNSILYNDWLLDQALGLLDQQPGSLALYLSDHGERFYENGVPSAGHGYPEPTRSEVEIPYWIWCQGDCPAAWRQAQTRHRQTPFSTEHLFYSLLGMLAIDTPDYRPALDILNPAYRPYPVKVISTSKTVYAYKQLPSR